MTTTMEPQATTDFVELARTIGAELAPGAAARDVAGAIAVDGFSRLRECGATAALVPAEFGGGGVTHAEAGAMLRELGRHDGSAAVTLSMHTHPVAQQVWRHRHGVDASAVLQKVAGGAMLATSGASDWISSSGAAVKVDGGYRVSGRKAPVSGCEVADVFVTSIRWDEPVDGPQVLHCSIPFAAEGSSIELTWDTLGLRATGSHTVVLDDVFLPDTAVALVRPADVWHPVWNMVLGAAMPLVVSAYLGIADAAVDLARDAVVGRTDPATIAALGAMTDAHLTAVDGVAAMFADSDDLRFDNTDEMARRTLSRKTRISDALIETVTHALELAGGRGYSRSSDLERLYRDVLGSRYHPLPRARQVEFTGRVAAGLSPIG